MINFWQAVIAVLVPRMPTFSSFLYAASTHISNETLCTDNALYLHYLKLFFYAVQNFIAVGLELYPISTLLALSERSLGSWKLNSGTLFQSQHSMLLCLTRQNWKKKKKNDTHLLLPPLHYKCFGTCNSTTLTGICSKACICFSMATQHTRGSSCPCLKDSVATGFNRHKCWCGSELPDSST